MAGLSAVERMQMKNFDIAEHFKKIDVLDKGSIELVDGMILDPNLKVVNSARVSFKKESEEFSDKDSKLVKYLYDHGHFSTYRHSFYTFRVKAPLFVFRQWWKYQIGSTWTHDDLAAVAIEIPETNWNEVSGRYVNLDPDFYIPSSFRKQSKNNKQGSEGEMNDFSDGSDISSFMADECERSYKAYQRMIDEGVGKEMARMLLPQNIYSECIWTCSLQALVHFFQQRLKDDAQYEIREYAFAVYKLLRPFMKDLIEIRAVDGFSWLREQLKNLESL